MQGSALKPVTVLPEAVRRRLAGAPIQIDGNVLDPDLQLLLRLEGFLPWGKEAVGRDARGRTC